MTGAALKQTGSRGRMAAPGLACAALILFGIGGCASNGDVATAALPSLPKITLPEAPPPVVGSATEVYARIGRGAMACWFGADGMLKTTHIYDATAEPEHKGGQAEITIRERDAQAQSPRGVKAFRISIAPASGEETTVVAENFKLPEAMAVQMKKSVAAWSTGSQGCDPDTSKGAWQPAAAAAEAPADKQKTTQRTGRVAKSKP